MNTSDYHAAVSRFVQESNLIEGITTVRFEDINAHLSLFELEALTIKDLQAFVKAVRGGPLRTNAGMDVVIGSHRPTPGGTKVTERLQDLLLRINMDEVSPFDAHVEFELLHPFMDGNGRSGRAVWAWMMMMFHSDPFALPFLHHFYYQCLAKHSP